ncbi:MAG: DHA2 family efflux MFS transporter permease subunit [Vulcanimicrobiaceae bacterium]
MNGSGAAVAPPSASPTASEPPPTSAATTPRRDVTERGTRRVLIVTGVMLAALLQTLDGTIVNVALPTIQGNLGASIDEATWVVTAYIIAAVIVIPIAPWLMNRFGRKQYFLTSIAGFTLASLACGLATSIEELIVFRVVQGLFGGGLLATSQAILRDTFPPKQLSLSQAIYTIGVVVGPSSGPTIGGLLTDNVSWRWVFDVNVVPGVIAIALLVPLLRNPSRQKVTGFDAIGLALLAIGLGSLQYVLDEGERNGWFADGAIVGLTLAAASGLVAFVVWELKGTANPIVDLRVLSRRGVAVGCAVAIVNACVVFGQLFLMPQWLTGVLGFTATQDGLLLAVRAIPVMLLTIPVGALVSSGKIDPRILIALGLAIAGSGVVGLGLVTTTTTEFATLVPYLVATGCGISLVFTPLLVAVLGSVSPADSPKAGAFVGLALNLGGSVSSASLVTLLDQRESFHSTVMGAATTLANPTVARAIAHGGIARVSSAVLRESANASYADTFYAIGAVAIVLSVLAFALPARSRPALAA